MLRWRQRRRPGVSKPQRGQPMNEADKQRNREIAKNEAERQTTGDIRVSAWTMAFTVFAGVVAVAIVWIWLHR